MPPAAVDPKRSALMSRVRREHTAPEVALRRELWARGVRYRLHARTPGGKPDLVFRGCKLAVFIDGCFWHGCPRHYVRPKTRRAFWDEKLEANRSRDRRQNSQLRRAGWKVIRVWECRVGKDVESVATRIEKALASRKEG